MFGNNVTRTIIMGILVARWWNTYISYQNKYLCISAYEYVGSYIVIIFKSLTTDHEEPCHQLAENCVLIIAVSNIIID